MEDCKFNCHNRTSMVKYVTVGKDMTVVFWDETGI